MNMKRYEKKTKEKLLYYFIEDTKEKIVNFLILIANIIGCFFAIFCVFGLPIILSYYIQNDTFVIRFLEIPYTYSDWIVLILSEIPISFMGLAAMCVTHRKEDISYHPYLCFRSLKLFHFVGTFLLFIGSTLVVRLSLCGFSLLLKTLAYNYSTDVTYINYSFICFVLIFMVWGKYYLYKKDYVGNYFAKYINYAEELQFNNSNNSL